MKSLFTGFLAGGLGAAAMDVVLWHSTGAPFVELLSMLLVNICIYTCLGYCYFHFINLGETARRIRIVREIHDALEGLTMEEILSRYNARTIVDKRLQRLLSKGQIVEKDGRYFAGKPAMLVMSRIIIAMKLILLGKKSEFD